MLKRQTGSKNRNTAIIYMNNYNPKEMQFYRHEENQLIMAKKTTRWDLV